MDYTASNADPTAAHRDRSASLRAGGTPAQPHGTWTPSPLRASASMRSDHPPRSMRKRHSFFGRSPSDAAGRTASPTVHSTMSSQPRTQPPSRPGTALSETRRRRTEPLEQIRNSLFGGRKKNAPSESHDALRPPSRDHPLAAGEIPPRERFGTEQEYYRYLRKLTISPPFHFEHVTHTEHGKLPPLETVDQRDLTAKFWAASAYERPKRHLHGINAQDLTEKLPAMGIERGASSSRPTSPVPLFAELPTHRPSYPGPIDASSSINETIFDEARETRFDPAFTYPAPEHVHPAFRRPRRQSSLGALNEQPTKKLQDAPDPTFYESNSSSESDAPSEQTQRPSPRAYDCKKPLRSVQEEPERTGSPSDTGPVDRETQPLPTIPGQRASKRESRILLGRSAPGTASVLSFASSDRRSSTTSGRSSRSVQKSPAVSNISSTSDVRHPSLMSDATWEEDVDFCYQQEAESTCNFDWQGPAPTQESSMADSEGEVRSSAWVAPSPISRSQSHQASRHDTAGYSLNKRASRDMTAQHQRGLSVGHRGFLAARRGSPDLAAKKHVVQPSISEYTPSNSTRVSILSPVFSVTGDTDETPKTPYSTKSMHFHDFDGVRRLSVDYPSDPESNSTGDSKHRKTSSYGSCDSAAKSAATGSTRERGRWSLVSSTSVPELLHSSKRRSRSSLNKSSISRPLEALPQSPNKPTEMEESTIVPRASQTEPMRNTFVMRHAQTSGEGDVQQGAGRSGRGSRSLTPSRRFSRLLSVEEGQLAATDAPEWI